MDLTHSQSGSGTDPLSGKVAHARNDSDAGGSAGEARFSIVMETVQKQLDAMEQSNQNVKTLAEAVSVMRKDIRELKKRKTEEEPNNGGKKARMVGTDLDSEKNSGDSVNGTGSGNKSGASPDIDLGNISSASEDDSDQELDEGAFDDYLSKKGPTEEEFSFLNDLEEFFTEQATTGVDVDQQLADLANKGLRGKGKNDQEKLKAFKDIHKPPKNVENLQVPAVEEGIWRILTPPAKAADFMLQRAQGNYSLALTPIMKALEIINKKGNYEDISKQVLDAFKILCLHFRIANVARADRIKKEVNPVYRAVCDNESSTSKLFGDDVQDTVKKLDTGKINFAMPSLSRSSFLGKRGGSHQQARPIHNAGNPKRTNKGYQKAAPQNKFRIFKRQEAQGKGQRNQRTHRK